MRKTLLLSGLLAVMYGCGGGAPVSTGVGDTPSVRIVSVDVSKSSVNAGDVFTVSWEVDFSSASDLYSEVKAYISPNQSVPDNPDYLFYLNCGGVVKCDRNGSVNCTYDYRKSGEAHFTCRPSDTTSTTTLMGQGYLVFSACVYNQYMEEVCDTRYVLFTVN